MIKATECEYNFDESSYVLIHAIDGETVHILPDSIVNVVAVPSSVGCVSVLFVSKEKLKSEHAVVTMAGDVITIPECNTYYTIEIISTDTYSSIFKMLEQSRYT